MVSLEPPVSPLPSVQNNPHAKVAHLGEAHSEPLQKPYHFKMLASKSLSVLWLAMLDVKSSASTFFFFF